MGTPSSLIIAGIGAPSLAIILLYPAILWRGAQSVTADRDIYYSNSSNKYKGVWQQSITEYQK